MNGHRLRLSHTATIYGGINVISSTNWQVALESNVYVNGLIVSNALYGFLIDVLSKYERFSCHELFIPLVRVSFPYTKLIWRYYNAALFSNGWHYFIERMDSSIQSVRAIIEWQNRKKQLHASTTSTKIDLKEWKMEEIMLTSNDNIKIWMKVLRLSVYLSS